MGRKEVESKREDEEEDLDESEEEETDDDEDEEGKSKASGSDADSDDDEDEDDDEEGDDLDSALADKGGKPSIFLPPWRKKGRITTWLHPKTKFAKVLRHKWFEIVQFTKRNKEEVSFIRYTNFVCHESVDFLSLSKDRGEDLRRDHHAHKCPMDLMIEWVEGEVIAGRIAPNEVIFRFDDGDSEHLVELHAAGLTGLINLDAAPERWRKQCKKAGVLQKNPWSENLNPKLSHVFQVVDDSDPSEVKWAVEPPDLFINLKEAIAKEKKRSGDDDGDPRIKPYALLWEFDEAEAKKNFGRGNSVTPQPKRTLTSKIERLLKGPKRTDQAEIVTPGNCLELRASMENAVVDGINMPFDDFFKPAKQAGLMKASSQQKPAQAKQQDKERDEEPKSDPKPKTSQKAKPAAATGKSNKEDDEPEDKKPASDASTCDMCEEEIGDDDFECNSCGTSFDQDNNYEIDGIKCKDCGTLVPVNDCETAEDASEHICPKCATVHKLMPSVRKFYDTLEQCRKSRKKFTLKFVWEVEKRHPPKEAKTDKPKGRGRKATESDSAKIDKALGGDKIPWE
jgi:hypothetical protein